MSEKIQPKVRFSGFTDAWEQRKLGDLADISRGASPRPIQNPIWFDSSSEVGWLRITDVTEQNGRIHHLEQHISKLGQEKTRVLTKPHLLLSIAATVGKPVVNYVQTGVHDGFLIFYNLKANREFVYQWLEMFRPLWQKYGQPGSQVNLNSELVKQQSIPLPSNDEQQEIVNILTKLDNTIALHQSKLEELKTVKKLAMQKIFDQEWRFKGFTDPWEQRKFKNYILKSGKNPKNPKEYIAYSVSNKSGLIKQSDQFEDSRLDSLNKISYKLVKPLEFAYNPARINVGSIAFNNTKKPVIVSSLYVVLKLNSSLNNEYILQFIRSADFINEVKRNTEGSVREYLFINNFKNIKFPYSPNKDEQIKIGELLSTLDSLIAANQQKCDQLKKVKKWCMQNLFV